MGHGNLNQGGYPGAVRALITGIGGFVGRHLRQHLEEQGDSVCGLGRPADSRDMATVRVFAADLSDRGAIDRIVREAEPEAVYHLAAQSSPAESLSDPWATIGNPCWAKYWKPIMSWPTLLTA